MNTKTYGAELTESKIAMIIAMDKSIHVNDNCLYILYLFPLYFCENKKFQFSKNVESLVKLLKIFFKLIRLII